MERQRQKFQKLPELIQWNENLILQYKEVEHVGLVLFKTTFQKDMDASAEKREIIMITGKNASVPVYR